MSARLTPEQRQLRAITEAQFQARITDLASLRGWMVYAPPTNRPRMGRSGKTYVENVRAGWPDLALVRGSRLVFMELKTEVGRLGPGQREWLDALAATSAEAYLFRPSDWPIVKEVLA